MLHRRDGGHLNGKWFENFARRNKQLPWASELGVSAHWLRHTTLTDIERVAGVRVAAAYAGHADNSLGVTAMYTKASLEELRAAHARLFFDHDQDADDAATAPDLLRRGASPRSARSSSPRQPTPLAGENRISVAAERWCRRHSTGGASCRQG